MTRIVDSGVATALAASHLRWAVFVDLDFLSAQIRAFNGVGEYTYQGDVFTGVGKFGRLGKVVERMSSRDFAPVTLELSGLPADLLLDKVPDRADYFNRAATIYFVVFNLETMQPEANEPAIYQGFMDQLQFKREGSTASISVTVRHHSTIWANAINLLYTHEHQLLIDSSDNVFNQVHDQKKELVWNGMRVHNNVGGNTGGSSGSPGEPRRPH